MRYFIKLSYLGTSFHGWQIQPNAHTVQEELEQSLSKILSEEIKVIGAGRTDTGVHASFYIAHFNTNSDDKLASKNFIYHLNSLISKDISIESIREVKDDASARFSAIEREYKYYISLKKNPFNQNCCYQIRHELDVEAMRDAASKLPEYKDFTSFARLHADTLNNLCNLTTAYFEQDGDMLIFTIRANRFLRNMVRAIVGTLLDVGRGKITTEQFCKIIEMEDRGKAGSSASPAGLFLTNITYPDDIYKVDSKNI